MVILRLIHDLCCRHDIHPLQAASAQIVVAAGTTSKGRSPTARPWPWPPSSARLRSSFPVITAVH